MCNNCDQRSAARTQQCLNCQEKDFTTEVPDSPFEVSYHGKKTSTTDKYGKYQNVVEKKELPLAKVYFNSVHNVNPCNFEAVKFVLEAVIQDFDWVKFLCSDGAILITAQAWWKEMVTIVAFGHVDFKYLEFLRKILMTFFGNEYQMVMNTVELVSLILRCGAPHHFNSMN